MNVTFQQTLSLDVRRCATHGTFYGAEKDPRCPQCAVEEATRLKAQNRRDQEIHGQVEVRQLNQIRGLKAALTRAKRKAGSR